MQTTVLKEIIAFLFGRKYYANIVGTKGTAEMQLVSLHRNNIVPLTERLFTTQTHGRSLKHKPPATVK